MGEWMSLMIYNSFITTLHPVDVAFIHLQSCSNKDVTSIIIGTDSFAQTNMAKTHDLNDKICTCTRVRESLVPSRVSIPITFVWIHYVTHTSPWMAGDTLKCYNISPTSCGLCGAEVKRERGSEMKISRGCEGAREMKGEMGGGAADCDCWSPHFVLAHIVTSQSSCVSCSNFIGHK